jgi:predicted aspartyl protease
MGYGERDMSIFKEEITLSNVVDKVRVECGVLKEIRALTVKAMPDTGSWTLVINEATREKLGLAIEGAIGASLADGSTATYNQTEAVKIQWKNRSTTQQALLVPGADDILLGALPLEAMDLMVDPVNERLVGVHGDQPLYKLKYAIRNEE